MVPDSVHEISFKQGTLSRGYRFAMSSRPKRAGKQVEYAAMAEGAAEDDDEEPEPEVPLDSSHPIQLFSLRLHFFLTMLSVSAAAFWLLNSWSSSRSCHGMWVPWALWAPPLPLPLWPLWPLPLPPFPFPLPPFPPPFHLLEPPSTNGGDLIE